MSGQRRDSTDPDACNVYWGHSGCALPSGHDPDQRVRIHRQFEPSVHAVTVRDAFLFGEDLTEEELRLRVELYGE
jgi:hypothetical protein